MRLFVSLIEEVSVDRDVGERIDYSGVKHLEEMEEYAEIKPAVNQIEVGHPF